MNKAKYKLGTLIEVTVEGQRLHGEVDGVLYTEDGVFYRVGAAYYAEDSVTGAFKALAPVKATKKTRTKRVASPVATAAHAAAGQPTTRKAHQENAFA
jgi:hypothetical protein